MQAPEHRSLNILVVDDETVVSDCILMLLAHDGHNVRTAANGRDALKLFDEGRFDVVMTDYSMPGMKGDELAAAIRARVPGQAILMLTADIEKLRSAGGSLRHVDEVIGKPFTLFDLRAALARVQEKKPPTG